MDGTRRVTGEMLSLFDTISCVLVQICEVKVSSEVAPVSDSKTFWDKSPEPHTCRSLGNRSGSKQQGNVCGLKKKCVNANKRDLW